MNKYFYALMLILVNSHFANAQQRDSTIKASVMQQGRYSSILYTVNGEPLTQAKLLGLLRSYPNSAFELDASQSQYRNQLTGTLICGIVGIASLVAASVQARQIPNNNNSDFNRSPFFYSLSIGSIITGFFFLKKNDHFDKAIEAYNSRF